MNGYDKPGPKPSASREIELKLDLDPADADAILEHPALKGRVGNAQSTRSTYYDTKKQRLRNAGVTLRVRSVDDQIVQTIKSGAQGGAGLFDRWELETSLPDAVPNLLLSESLPEVLEDSEVRRSLRPVFETRIDRRSGIVDWNGSRIEVVLDEGQVLAREERQPLAELELELIEGSPEALFAFARELQSRAALRLGVISKSERGERLIEGKSGRAMKAEPVILSPDDSAAKAFQAIAFSCLRHFRANEPLVLGARDPDALHQSRVALRRLRSSFSLFKPILKDPALERFRLGYRDLAASLGEARNLDVLLRRRGELMSASVRDHLTAERGRAYDAAIDSLQSSTSRGLILDFAEWVSMQHFTGGASRAGSPAIPFSGDVLSRFWKKVKERGKLLARLDDEGRHELRIAGKKLRYAGEFFSSLYASGSAGGSQQFLQAMEALQDKLGDLNDLATEVELESILAARGIQTDEIGGRRDQPAERSRLIAEAAAAFDNLRKIGPYWKRK